MTIAINSVDDIRTLRESWNVECKLAQGRHGRGTLPEDIWETYSAFANTAGGNIFLGLEELPDGSFRLAGIENPRQVMRELWQGLNDRKKVSSNVLCVDSLAIIPVEDTSIIHIHVPKAPPSLSPVFINGNPVTGSYHRVGDADVRQSEDKIRKLMARKWAAMVGKS